MNNRNVTGEVIIYAVNSEHSKFEKVNWNGEKKVAQEMPRNSERELEEHLLLQFQDRN
jgi:hypothetical protein